MKLLTITEWWYAMPTIEQIFWGIAIVFTTFFIIQFGLSVLGLDFDADADADLSDGGYSLDPSFTLLSVRSIIAFFVFFGWTGVLAIGRGYSTTTVFLMAAGAGLIAMVVVAYLMYFFYKLAEEIADIVWDIVSEWDYFAKDTVGKQLVNSADSIGANLAEGYGRGSHTDNRRFAKISRGSLFEVKHWLRRAYRRDLLTEDEVSKLHSLINELTPKLSAYIRSIGKKKTKSDKKNKP